MLLRYQTVSVTVTQRSR